MWVSLWNSKIKWVRETPKNKNNYRIKCWFASNVNYRNELKYDYIDKWNEELNELGKYGNFRLIERRLQTETKRDVLKLIN